MNQNIKLFIFKIWAQPDLPLPYFDPKAEVKIVLFDLLSNTCKTVGSLIFGSGGVLRNHIIHFTNELIWSAERLSDSHEVTEPMSDRGNIKTVIY